MFFLNSSLFFLFPPFSIVFFLSFLRSRLFLSCSLCIFCSFSFILYHFFLLVCFFYSIFSPFFCFICPCSSFLLQHWRLPFILVFISLSFIMVYYSFVCFFSFCLSYSLSLRKHKCNQLQDNTFTHFRVLFKKFFCGRMLTMLSRNKIKFDLCLINLHKRALHRLRCSYCSRSELQISAIKIYWDKNIYRYEINAYKFFEYDFIIDTYS